MVTKKAVGPVAGKTFYEYTVTDGDLSVTLSEYAASIHTLMFGGVDMVAGYEKAEDYLSGTSNQGATIGRVANRIAGGTFDLNGKTYTLDQNNGTNCLHGGTEGLGHQFFTGREVGESSVAFTITSPDGQGGFPGNLTLTVTYTVEDNTLKIAYEASADQDTPMNFTNHVYFTLGAEDLAPITLQVMAPAYLPIGENMIPTGKIIDVTYTPFDFRMPHSILRDIEKDDEQLKLAGGFDHNFVLFAEHVMRYNIATARNTENGVCMTVSSDLPGLQVYSGNNLKGEKGKNGKPLNKRTSFCLETQYFPNTPNTPAFPSCIVPAGEVYQSQTWYHFSK